MSKGDGKYFALTPRILDLGFAYLSSQPSVESGHPGYGNAGRKSVQESCSAGVLDGLDVVYVVRVHTHKIMSTNSGRGLASAGVLDLHGAGCCWQGCPDDKLQALMATRPREAFTRYTLTGGRRRCCKRLRRCAAKAGR